MLVRSLSTKTAKKAKLVECVLLVLLAAAPSAGTTGIVVHGYHRQAHNWEEVVWGDMANQHLGRLPQAALLAWESRHELATFICGSGASCDAAGMIEAHAIVALLFERLPSLAAFERFRGVDLVELAQLLHRTVVTDTVSTNTEQEVRSALVRLQQAGVRHAVLISSPTHMPRCLRDACSLASKVGYVGSLAACPCDTSWSSEAPIVLEPAHRPDAVRSASFYHLARRASALAFQARSEDKRRRFLAALDALLCSFESHGDESLE